MLKTKLNKKIIIKMMKAIIIHRIYQMIKMKNKLKISKAYKQDLIYQLSRSKKKYKFSSLIFIKVLQCYLRLIDIQF